MVNKKITDDDNLLTYNTNHFAKPQKQGE